MPFFKDFRRRSRVNLGLKEKEDNSCRGSTNDSVNDSANGSSGTDTTDTTDTSAPLSNGTVPTSTSSSTLSSLYGSNNNIQLRLSSPNLSTNTKTSNGSNASSPTVRRPPMTAIPKSNRYSVAGMSMASAAGSSKAFLPFSPYAPKITSITDGTLVHQDLLLISGQIGDPDKKALDGNLAVSHAQDTFPIIDWPVYGSYFKALISLSPGHNKIRFEFSSSQLATKSSLQSHYSILNVHYLPRSNAPPLQLAIVLAKDSPEMFDAAPEKIYGEGNKLETAIRKFRMAAYLWQVFTAEQMRRNGFPRRCFRFEEEWQTGTRYLRDQESLQMRNEARIHIVRSDLTVEQLKGLETEDSDSTTLARSVYVSLKDYFRPLAGQKQYVIALLLDSHWDPKTKAASLAANFGGCYEQFDVAMIDSQALHSYPSCVEDIIPSFTDSTPTDPRYVANEGNVAAASNWETASKSLQHHLHQIGHLFDCSHSMTGIMNSNALPRFHRTFLTREAYLLSTRSEGLQTCLLTDETIWSRTDALHLRYHPCFRLPNDPRLHPDNTVAVWQVEKGKIILQAPSGVAFVEVFTDDDDQLCRALLDYVTPDSSPGSPSKEAIISESDVRAKLQEDKKKKNISIRVNSAGNGSLRIRDISGLRSSVKIPLPKGQIVSQNGFSQTGYRGNILGSSELGQASVDVILDYTWKPTKLLISIKIYHGIAIAGLEFCYEDLTSQVFGSKEADVNVDEFQLNTRKAEVLSGFFIRATDRIDAIQLLTSYGRRSGVFGNAVAGTGYTLVAPRMYMFAGVSGTYGDWINSMSLIIKS
ncbi:MAG: hypothetical protein M1834_008668 [Cirrosporium novae-zelandiae]|nr:MAG: hypothetical protein M1834_008668 [Cirrosporium novae-zelandiae]